MYLQKVKSKKGLNFRHISKHFERVVSWTYIRENNTVFWKKEVEIWAFDSTICNIFKCVKTALNISLVRMEEGWGGDFSLLDAKASCLPAWMGRRCLCKNSCQFHAQEYAILRPCQGSNQAIKLFISTPCEYATTEQICNRVFPFTNRFIYLSTLNVKNQCSRCITLDMDPDPRIRTTEEQIQIWILLSLFFGTVAFKMSKKSSFRPSNTFKSRRKDSEPDP